MNRGTEAVRQSVSWWPRTGAPSGVRATQVLSSGPDIGGPRVPTRFQLLDKLGQGGMGVVYRAIDTHAGREVALKSLCFPRPDDLYRLKREFRYLTELRHPNLIEMYELFADGCQGFVTMELVTGMELVSFVRGPMRERPDMSRLLDAARQLAAALAAVHAAGKLHRDLKPSNVMVTQEGRIVVLDFGLAAALSGREAKTKSAGILLGTRGYVAPEQARGEALTTAADWYSFGVTLFEAATGELPFEDMLRAFRVDRNAPEVPRIGANVRDVPPALDELVARLIDPRPDRRPTEAHILGALGAMRDRAPNRGADPVPLVTKGSHGEENVP